jgi:hypothetical protein
MPAAKAALHQLGAALEARAPAGSELGEVAQQCMSIAPYLELAGMADGSHADYGRLTGLIFSLAFALHEQHAAIVALGPAQLLAVAKPAAASAAGPALAMYAVAHCYVALGKQEQSDPGLLT